MTEGQTINHIRGTGPPLQSWDLGLVAALGVSGFDWSSPKALLDTVEGNAEAVKREYIWTFDGDCKAEFLGPDGLEEMNFAEFVERFRDEAWCEANPHHPIAYMRGMWNRIVGLREYLRTAKPLLKIQKVVTEGDTTQTVTCLIPQDLDEETRAELLRRFQEAT